MKRRLMEVGIVGLIAVSMVGCVSQGGARYVGPISAWNAGRIDTAKQARNVAASTKIPMEKKEPIIKAINMSMAPGEIAAGYQIDVLSLLDGGYTAGELASQVGAATLDLAGEAAAGVALYNTVNKSSSKTSSTTYNVNGNNNQFNGNGTQRNNAASGGGANGDINGAIQ